MPGRLTYICSQFRRHDSGVMVSWEETFTMEQSENSLPMGDRQITEDQKADYSCCQEAPKTQIFMPLVSIFPRWTAQ